MRHGGSRVYHRRFSFVTVTAEYKSSFVFDGSITLMLESNDGVFWYYVLLFRLSRDHKVERFSSDEVNHFLSGGVGPFRVFALQRVSELLSTWQVARLRPF